MIKTIQRLEAENKRLSNATLKKKRALEEESGELRDGWRRLDETIKDRVMAQVKVVTENVSSSAKAMIEEYKRSAEGAHQELERERARHKAVVAELLKRYGAPDGLVIVPPPMGRPRCYQVVSPEGGNVDG